MSMKEYNIAMLEDKDGQNNIKAEVNFDPKRKKFVRMTIDGKSAVISIKDLHAFVFAIADINQKADLLPHKTSYSRKLIRSHVVELKETVEKGGQVTIRCETDIPLTIYQKLEAEQAENLKQAFNS